MAYETLIVDMAPGGRAGVLLIQLNRPQALNALNSVLLSELGAVLNDAADDDAVACVVLTGSEKAFAAGADIKEMSAKTYAEMFRSDFFGAAAAQINAFRKPIIAAVVQGDGNGPDRPHDGCF